MEYIGVCLVVPSVVVECGWRLWLRFGPEHPLMRCSRGIPLVCLDALSPCFRLQRSTAILSFIVQSLRTFFWGLFFIPAPCLGVQCAALSHCGPGMSLFRRCSGLAVQWVLSPPPPYLGWFGRFGGLTVVRGVGL